MRVSFSAALWRLVVFTVVCLFFTFAMFAIFSQLRFQREAFYNADFTNVSGLKNGQFVRIAGVEVGKVKAMSIKPDNTVEVMFSADPSVVLTEGTRAVIRYDDLIGGRYMALEEGAGGTRILPAGNTIPLARTSPALDLDALIGGFRPLFRALDPDQVNALSGQLISAFEGQGDTIGSFFRQTATLTNKLSDRDHLIGQVITNLNAVLGSLGDQSSQFAQAVDSLAGLVQTLSDRRQDISAAVASANSAAGSIADLMMQARPPLQKVVHETDRAAALVLADHEYVENLIDKLPDKYRALERQAVYGDFFSFYLCDLALKVNGKGGQPVYIKLAGQDTGRCAPR